MHTKKNNKIVLIIILSSFAVLIVSSIISLMVFFFDDNWDEIEKRSLPVEFHGNIKSISVSEKGISTVEIKDSFYYIPAVNNNQLSVGDSIVKRENKNVVYRFEHNHVVDSFIGPVIVE